MLEHLDRVASALEARWGFGALRLAVEEDLRRRFDAQKEKLDNAIAADAPAEIKKHAAAMLRAWQALEAAAIMAGVKPPGECVWVGGHPTAGKVCVYTSDASLSYLPDGVPRFHIDELVAMIPSAVVAAKGHWPDATVERVREPLDDDLPF